MTIHDHFDGSAHCVQCKGHCNLTGDDLAVTQLVRATFELMAVQGREPPMFVSDAMKSLRAPTHIFMRRAQELVRRKK